MKQTNSLIPNTDKRKLLWRARRGMLELDLLLIPFIENCFEQLSEAELTLFHTFLHEDDVCIMAWLSGREQPNSPKLLQLVDKILAHARRQ